MHFFVVANRSHTDYFPKKVILLFKQKLKLSTKWLFKNTGRICHKNGKFNINKFYIPDMPLNF